MAIPNFQKFLLPVLKHSAQKEQTYKTCEPVVSAELGLTTEEREEMISSQKSTKAQSRVYWAKTYLNQAGLVEFHKRGYFRVTDSGKKLLSQHPVELTIKILEQYPQFLDFMSRSRQNDVGISSLGSETIEQTGPDPTAKIETGINEINALLKQDILNNILDNTPKFFELLILDLLRAMGYGVSDESKLHIGGPGDEGIDGVISQDVLGLDKIYVQAKRYKPDNIITGPHISNFCGALGFKGAHKGVFVTTSRFSSQATELHTRNSNYKIVLIDGDMLAGLMIKYNIGVSVENTYQIKRIDTDYFQDDL